MNARGFTLVEVLVALFVFSIMFLPLAVVLSAESKFERSYERKTTALLVAGNEIEKYKRKDAAGDNREYGVFLAGRSWTVRRTLETVEAGAADSAVYKESYLTVSVSPANDTAVLAELRVIKETYR